MPVSPSQESSSIPAADFFHLSTTQRGPIGSNEDLIHLHWNAVEGLSALFDQSRLPHIAAKAFIDWKIRDPYCETTSMAFALLSDGDTLAIMTKELLTLDVLCNAISQAGLACLDEAREPCEAYLTAFMTRFTALHEDPEYVLHH